MSVNVEEGRTVKDLARVEEQKLMAIGGQRRQAFDLEGEMRFEGEEGLFQLT